MKTIKGQVRQGDVLITPCASIPKAAKRRKREGGLVVLARGEATGHHHSFGSRLVNAYAVADEFENMGSGYIEVKGLAGVPLKHQEHGPVKASPGSGRVTRQREYVEGAIVRTED